MGKYEKLLLEILRGKSDANIEFDELCQLLRSLALRKGYAAVIIASGGAALKKRSICNEIRVRQRSTRSGR